VPENNPLLSYPAEKGFSKGNPVLFLGFLLILGQGWYPPDLSGVSYHFEAKGFLNVKRVWARLPCGRALTAVASAQKESL
jgi:hypothetical protein